MNAYSKTGSSGQLVLDFEDNRLLPSLFGPHDSHLARIEQALGVSIVTRGNRALIRGPMAACLSARTSLNDLYRRLEDGQVIDLGDVDGAVRMAQAEASRIAPKPRKKGQKDRPPKAAAAPGSGRPLGQRGGNGLGRKGGGGGGDGTDGGEGEPGEVAIRTRMRTIVPRTPRQADYMAGMATTELVFGVGPAGTGKTYLAVARAVACMAAGEIDRIVLSRPAVEAGENLGFLPGDMKDKVDPYLRPLYDALYDMLPADQVERRIGTGQIEVAPLAYMRGRTLKNAFVILDEAQNTTQVQMKMFLTRLGENSRMVVCGDPSQCDLGPRNQSGLAHALRVLHGVKGVDIVEFGEEDVIRHPLVTRIVKAYDSQDPRPA